MPSGRLGDSAARYFDPSLEGIQDLTWCLAEGMSVVMGAANDTGIGGITLGGGSGFLTGRYGLVIDNLLAARVVIADGTVLECSEESNSDIFWAIRGGGSNFGVVTEFTYKIHKQGDVVLWVPPIY